ncbi:MAG: hypothetical protein CMD99_10130 [Gammaproteobacteria bacterium]|nr:hypothetical protein [Gammaproteobacteria bacterium]
MKQLICALLLASSATGVSANPVESRLSEHIGFGSGAALGAVVGGPVGAVVGSSLGALIGHDVVQERALAKKNKELSDLNLEISVARSQLAQLNAAQVTKKAQLVALRKLLSDLSVAVHFDVDSSMTAQRYREALEAISAASQSVDGLTVRLVGHADPRGSETYNQRLSEARALSVGKVLQEGGGSRMTIQTEGRGEKQALADGRSGFYAMDRRVDVELNFDPKAQNEGLYSLR